MTGWSIEANNDIFTMLYTCHENIQITATSTSSLLGILLKKPQKVGYREKSENESYSFLVNFLGKTFSIW